jgi:hypothetical protein
MFSASVAGSASSEGVDVLGAIRERSGRLMTRMMRSVLLTSRERPLLDSLSKDIIPTAILVLCIIFLDSVSIMLI